jgi:hypothetical protein
VRGGKKRIGSPSKDIVDIVGASALRLGIKDLARIILLSAEGIFLFSDLDAG